MFKREYFWKKTKICKFNKNIHKIVKKKQKSLTINTADQTAIKHKQKLQKMQL